MKQNELEVTFRYCKIYDDVEMFFYEGEGIRKELTCFTMDDGHSSACYKYYVGDTVAIKKVIANKGIDERVEKIKKYYEADGDITLRVMQKLKR